LPKLYIKYLSKVLKMEEHSFPVIVIGQEILDIIQIYRFH